MLWQANAAPPIHSPLTLSSSHRVPPYLAPYPPVAIPAQHADEFLHYSTTYQLAEEMSAKVISHLLVGNSGNEC